jgi:membrane protein DedA with SNARE-associated domain
MPTRFDRAIVVEGALLDFAAWLEELQPVWIYIAVFVISYVENIVPPIPGDMVIVFVGYLVGLGYVSFVPTYILATVGGALGFMTMYAVGWQVGSAVFDRSRMRWVPKAAAWRARAWILKYGFAVVLVNRFLAGARSVISLTVGAAQMESGPTAVWATVSSALWCLVILALGYLVGDQWGIIGGYLRAYGQWVTVLLITAISAAVGYRLWVRSRRRRSR